MDVVEYDLQEDDVVAFGIVNLRLSRLHLKLMKILIGLGCAFVVGQSAWLILVNREVWTGWFSLVLGLLMLLVLVPKLIWRLSPGLLRRHLRAGKNRALFGPQRMELLGEGFRRSNSQMESKVNWSSVEKLVSSKNHLGIYIGANHVIVVPKRAFKTRSDEAAFRLRVEQFASQKFAETPH